MKPVKLALKVDVDTYEGMRLGVPKLLALFQKLDIKAAFYIPFGPDESGKAIFRIFKKPGFLTKMFRTNPVKLYGIKTMLRGTLLPAPCIGSSFPEIAKEVIRQGHELGIHGYNHVEWQDHLLEMTPEAVRGHVEEGVRAYTKAIGEPPRCFAAPAWLSSPTSFKILDEFNFDYASDTRGNYPFYPRMGYQTFKTLQMPSTLPTLDELLGAAGANDANVHTALNLCLEQSNLSLHVHSIHTEVEGGALFSVFNDWVLGLKNAGVSFVRLGDEAAQCRTDPRNIPICLVALDKLPGRAGLVACQKTDLAGT